MTQRKPVLVKLNLTKAELLELYANVHGPISLAREVDQVYAARRIVRAVERILAARANGGGR